MESQEITTTKIVVIQETRYDLSILMFLIALITLVSYQFSQYIDDFIYHKSDFWFDTDVLRVTNDMTNRFGNHWRTNVHPLFPLMTYPPTKALRIVFQLTPAESVRTIITIVASLWISTLFILLRLIGCRRIDATLFSILGVMSAASVFWFTVPETFSFGSLSILLSLGIIVLAQHRKISLFWYVIVSVLTFSFTITNWMAGIIMAFVKFSRQRALIITTSAFCAVVLLWTIQSHFFPKVLLFHKISGEKRYMLPPKFADRVHVARSFVFHSIVMPAFKLQEKVKDNNKVITIMATQSSSPGSGSVWGVIAVGLWTPLFGLGLWSLFFSRQNRQLRIALGLILLGQFVLHLMYGTETFLYSLHFAPLLVILAALSTQTRVRLIALTLTGILLVFLILNNIMQFNRAVDVLHSLATK